jgi:hypothetical protein
MMIYKMVSVGCSAHMKGHSRLLLRPASVRPFVGSYPFRLRPLLRALVADR